MLKKKTNKLKINQSKKLRRGISLRLTKNNKAQV